MASNTPRKPRDEWGKKLWRKHGLGEQPSMDDIEPVATELFADPLTLLEAAEIVLGRRVSTSEKVIEFVCKFSDPKDRFGAALLEAEIDERKKAQ